MTAAEALALLEAIGEATLKMWALYHAAQTGTVAPSDALAEIAKTHNLDVATDAKADKELHDKFDKGGAAT